MRGMPITVRRSIELLGICLVGLVIVTGQAVIMPLLMAFFISLLLLPIMRWLQRRKIPEIAAIVMCIGALFLAVAGIIAFLSFQIGGFLSDFDSIQKNLTLHWNNLSEWISNKTHF